jgi:(S)-3,5-dihydroxyphenylglycine transaminase
VTTTTTGRAAGAADTVADAARRRLRPDVWDFIAGGAGAERTLRANEAAFDRYTLLPRVLAGVGAADPAVTVLGTRWSAPLGVAPMGYHTLVDDDGEVATARAAGHLGLPLVVSTFAGRTFEEIAGAARGPLWLQLYWFRDEVAVADLVGRAERAGFTAIVLTVDAPRLGRRLRDVRNGFRLPRHVRPANLAPAAFADPAAHALGAFAPALGWDVVARLRTMTGLPVIVKGVLAAADARAALDAGVDAIVVSNHGGRQLDGTPAAVDALPAVVAAAAGRLPVFLDGGVRRGTDVLTALGLGAAAVFVGRPVLHALAAGGSDGVRSVLGGLVEELGDAMVLAGRSTVSACDRTLVTDEVGRPLPEGNR